MVEDEADIPKFKDYQVSSSPSAPAEAKAPAPSETAPPKEESEPPKAPEPKPIRAEEASQKGDRIFASPLARKLAEDNKVCFCLFVLLLFYFLYWLRLCFLQGKICMIRINPDQPSIEPAIDTIFMMLPRLHFYLRSSNRSKKAEK
jgi:hypothetical protein